MFLHFTLLVKRSPSISAMLVFAALVPHPLVSIPEIGKKEAARFRKTARALRALREELYAAKPDTIVVITPHAPAAAAGYSINQSPTLTMDFSTYGDLLDRGEFKTDLGFGYRIRESLEHEGHAVLVADATLDYGSAVCLFHLASQLPTEPTRFVVIGTAGNAGEHAVVGKHINRQINESTKRIAVLATGDLLHGAAKNPVTPYSPKSAAFNKRVVDLINKTDAQSLLTLAGDNHEVPLPCIVQPLLLWISILAERKYHFSTVSSETVLGAGYMTAQATLF